MYANLTHKNKSSIKRYSHGRRIQISRELIAEYNFKKVLDYGSGDGIIFLHDDVEFPSAEKICLFEPLLFDELNQNLEKYNAGERFTVEKELPQDKFDLITCFEVLEHFEDRSLIDRINEIKSVMAVDGILLISVPVEIGISGLIKNLIRIFLRQSHPNTTLSNTIKALFGLNILRKSNEDGYIDSHIGFDHRALECQLLKSGFTVTRSLNSPVNLPIIRILSSQKFFVCKR